MKISIKVGSSSLVHQGELQHNAFAHISQQATKLVDDGHQVAITTSGFAAAGGNKNQEAYTTGGKLIATEWQRHLGQKFGGLELVRRATLRQSVELVRNALNSDEIVLTNGYFGDHCFGGNDQLAVELARNLKMDRVILLGDMTGIRRDMDDVGSVLSRIELDRIDDYRQYIGAVSLSGTGGIEAKFAAAQDAATAGIITHYGHWQTDIEDLLAGNAGTTFLRGGLEFGAMA